MKKSILANMRKAVVSLIGTDVPEGGNVSYKINRAITINGEKKWVHANSEQEYADKLMKLFVAPAQTETHNFSDYSKNWFELYCKPNVEKATVACYNNLLRKHILPALGAKNLEEISADDIQKLFNGMTGAKTTKRKAKAVLNMIFDTALDDDLVDRNPVQAKRIKITGKDSTTTPVYSVEQMRYLIAHIGDVQNMTDRTYLALQALHPMRLEEVLGLKWNDIDFSEGVIHIRRAVTHPDRNHPEIKGTKTELSARTIALSRIAAGYLVPGSPEDFVIGGERPLTYHRVTCMCDRIRRNTGFEDKVTPKRFRTTVLTDIYDQTKDVKATQAAAGHTTSEMTFEHYVKGRGGQERFVSAVDSVYGA